MGLRRSGRVLHAAMTDVPMVFGSGRGLFGVLTAPDARRSRGVVVCAPFGHPNVCSYRPLRTLARRLADRGWPVLRFDWPGVGDSSDPERGADLARAWAASVGDAVTELRTRTGVEEVVLVGLGIGATLAAAVAGSERSGGVADVVLLGPYVSGKAYLREARAFHALAESQFSQPDVAPPPLEEGALEVSGFVLSREEVEALTSFDLTAHELSGLAGSRALIVGAQGGRSLEALASRLADAGADVTSTVSGALAHAWDGTLRSVMPTAISTTVADWLDAGAPDERRHSSSQVTVPSPAASTVDGGSWREHPLVLDTDDGRLVGILCEPVSDEPRDEWVVFLNAGRVRKIGPNRMATEYARAWAATGLPSLRLDLPGIGDSDGHLVDDESPALPDARWYARPVFGAAARAALDRLSADHGARRFALIGLCSGASWAYEVAQHDDRVAAVTLLNPRLLFPDRRAELLDAWAEARRIARHPRTWDAWRHRGLRSLPTRAVRGAALTLIGRGDPSWQRDCITESMTRLRSGGTRVEIIYSDGDPGIRYFQRHLGSDWLGELARCGASVKIVRGPDHTFRPPWSRVVVKEMIESRLAETGFLVGGEVDTAVA